MSQHCSMATFCFPTPGRSLAFLAFLVLHVGTAGADTPSYKIVHYDVSGKTKRDIERSLQKEAPRLNGQIGWGRTDFLYTADWKTVYLNGGYTAVNVKVRTDIRIRMPRWANYANASPCTKKAWDYLQSSLLRHELGHVDIASGLDKEIERRISALMSFSTEEALEKAAMSAQRKAMDENAAKQRKYDRITAHGAKSADYPVKLPRCK